MREYKDELENNGIKVHYFPLDERKKDETYFDFLKSFILEKKLNNINLFEIEDKDLEKQIIDGAFYKDVGLQDQNLSVQLCKSRQELYLSLLIKSRLKGL